MQGILGKKLGMIQVFDEDGAVVPVTVVQAGPCVVVQRKTSATDGYDAVQLGLVEEIPPRYVTKPRRGHFAKAGVAPTRRVAEFAIGDVAGDQEGAAIEVGTEIGASIFSVDELVDVTGTSKGKGFQGVVKRHGFRGGRATHGSMFHRAPGSIGQSSDPSRVYPGLRLPGQMGGKRVTTKNVRVVRVEADKNLLFLKGPVPGPNNGYVAIRRARRG
jgi:large subunit ribosomal protein L3